MPVVISHFTVSDCLFCKIAGGELKADVVYEDDAIMALKDIHPKYPTHILLIPKKHMTSATSFSPGYDRVVGKLLRVGGELARQQGIQQSGYRLLINTGPDSGQEVQHLHVHLMGGAQLRPL